MIGLVSVRTNGSRPGQHVLQTELYLFIPTTGQLSIETISNIMEMYYTVYCEIGLYTILSCK